MNKYAPLEYTFSTNSDVIMQEDWAKIYSILKRQIINGEEYKAGVIKACKRILEDFDND